VLLVTLGDLLLDVIVRVDAPIAADTDTYGRTHVGAGGQAANVAGWAAALGADARFVGKRADDAAGRIAAEELRARGVELAGPVAESGTGTVVSLATPDGKRAMLSDRGVAVELDAVEPEWLVACDRLHVPAYSLVVSPLREAALAAARLAPRVSIDLSSTAAIEAAGVDAVLALLLIAEGTDRQPFGDLALVLAVVSFVGGIAYLRFVEAFREE
jgi:sugar/nucleoside kinase (ribokinase family)